MIESIERDVIVIGAGTAGLVARRNAATAGASTLMVDPGPLGTTCARVGCMPSKMLIAAADAAETARTADTFGVSAGGVKVDGHAVMVRVRALRDRFAGGVARSTLAFEATGEFMRGRARFIGPNEIEILDADGTQIATAKAKAMVIATGSKPWVPPPFRPLTAAVASSTDEFFEWETLPESVLVVGTGVIGLELGQALHRLGVRTTLVGVGGVVGPLSDPELRVDAAKLFAEKLDLHADYDLKSIEEFDCGVKVHFKTDDGTPREETYERVLYASGRRPVHHTLNLEAAGIPTGERGALSADPQTMQIGNLPVFLPGDANNERPLLHEAADEGRIAGQNAARFPDVQAHTRRTPLAVVFTHPQMATVGKTFTSMNCAQFRIGSVDYGDQGRARVMAVNEGGARIYADRETTVLLGAEFLSPGAEHLAHLLAWAIQQRMTVAQALEMPFYHPVLEEGVRTALQSLAKSLSRGGPVGNPCEIVGPGA